MAQQSVLTVRPLEKYTGAASSLPANSTEALRTKSYGDGFGGVGQQVRLGFTPSGKDLVERFSYDALARKTNSLLPVPMTDGSAYTNYNTLLTQARTYYGENRVEAETAYEPSLRDLPLSTANAGDAWADRSVATTYTVNQTDVPELSCKRYRVDYLGALQPVTTYPAGTLRVACMTDEDGKRRWDFTDGQGRTVLARTESSAGNYEDTYYVYDWYDNLAYVFTPMYQQEPDLQKYAYEYQYTDRDLLSASRRPGEEFTYYRYDLADRRVFSQTGLQREQGLCTFYLYDPFGRLCLQGECTESTFPEVGQTVMTTSFSGGADGIGGTGYSSPLALQNAQVELANYYDTYDFLSLPGFSALPTLSGNTAPTGHLTGGMQVAEGSSSYLYTSQVYDLKGRVTASAQTNLLGGYDKEETVYTFDGRPQKVTRTHTASGKTARTEVYDYTYDHAARLTKVEHTLDGSKTTLATYTYDELGRLQSKTPHGTASNKLTYSYNIRDWVTGISGNKFSQSLYYTDGVGTPCYNGNISSMTWKSGNESALRGYQFTYDGLDRLTLAKYGENPAMDRYYDIFNEKVTAYDKNGNILGLQRNGQIGAGDNYGLIDNLTYTLNGNQLSRVDDAVGTAEYNGGFEFRDAVQQADEYAYDANGNLTKDLNRNISEVQYNFLNLPGKVTFTDGSTIEYVYAADGTKLQTTHVINGTTTTTDYCGNVVYENGVQKYLLTEEGYVTLADNRYHYYLQDHQGNNRVVVDGNGTVEEVNHYYPFGGTFAGSTSVQPYKYNGKEFDTKKGLDWYDYGARHYDPVLGRFTSLDPLAEDYSSISAYVYCLNNPIRYVDPIGMQSNDIIIDGGTIPEITIIRSRVASPISGFWENLQYILFGRSMKLPVYGIDMQGNQTGTIIGFLWFDISRNGYIKGLTPQSGIAPIPTTGIKNVEKLLKVANQASKAGLTSVGRALQKHGDRIGSVYPKAVGTQSAINAQGEKILKDILSNPNVQRTVNSNNIGRYGGNVVDYKIPNGMGARFNADESRFIGFLEP